MVGLRVKPNPKGAMMTAAERAAEVLWKARDRWMRDFAQAQRDGRRIGTPQDAQVAAENRDLRRQLAGGAP